MRSPVFLTFLLLLAAHAADKRVGPVKAGDDAVELTGSVALGKEAATKALGMDPGVDMIVVDIRVRPKTEGKLAVSRDDFTLISRRDGQRSQALHPSQIAGSASLTVVSRGPGAQGGVINQGEGRGPIWGGIPGTGTRPRRIGGDGEASTPVDPGETKATINKEKEENPLLARLKEKELRQGPTADPVTGLLYFIFDGKHKMKDLELMYKGPGGTLMLDFEK